MHLVLRICYLPIRTLMLLRTIQDILIIHHTILKIKGMDKQSALAPLLKQHHRAHIYITLSFSFRETAIAVLGPGTLGEQVALVRGSACRQIGMNHETHTLTHTRNAGARPAHKGHENSKA